MADYIIQNSNKDKEYTIPNKSFNKTDTDLVFIGEDTLKYGTALQQDLLNLLTHFYAVTPESFNEIDIKFVKDRAIAGQIIYDGTDLWLCTDSATTNNPNNLVKISLSPCKSSVTFTTDSNYYIENALVDGQIDGHIIAVSSGVKFKENIEKIPNAITFKDFKNINGITITNIKPKVTFISSTTIWILIDGIITPNDVDINSGQIIIEDAAFELSTAIFDKTYNITDDNKILCFPTITKNHKPTGTVTISGDPTVGKTLTASNTLADVDGLGSIIYEWYIDDANIMLNGKPYTGESYALQESDAGKNIKVLAKYTDGLGTKEEMFSNVLVGLL
jgi:hypothetical protein